MKRGSTKDELDLAAQEFKTTFKAFEKAAKNLIAILDNMNQKRYQEIKALWGKSKDIRFLSPDNGYQWPIWRNVFRHTMHGGEGEKERVKISIHHQAV